MNTLTDRDRDILAELAWLTPEYPNGVVPAHLCGQYAANTLRSLERRGLTRSIATLSSGVGGGFQITDAGRTTLAANSTAAPLTEGQKQVLRAMRACEKERRHDGDVIPVSDICRYVDYRINFIAKLVRGLVESGHLERVSAYPIKGYRRTTRGRADTPPLERSHRATVVTTDVLDADALARITALMREHAGVTVHIHSDVTEF